MSKRLKLNTVLPTLGWDVTLKILYELTLAYIDDIAVSLDFITMKSMEQNIKNLGLICSIHSKVYTGRIKQLYTKSKQLLYTHLFGDVRELDDPHWGWKDGTIDTRSIDTYWDGYKTKQCTRDFIRDLCTCIKRYTYISDVYDGKLVTVITRDCDIVSQEYNYKIQLVTGYSI